MSAWVVNKEHIDVLVSLALSGARDERDVRPDHGWRRLSWFEVDPFGPEFESNEPLRTIDRDNLDEVGRMLWQENVASVAYRYPDDNQSSRPGPVSDDIDAEAENYEWTDPRYRSTIGEAFQTIGCYEYQSCEHPEWRTSEAKRFCDSLRDHLAAALYEGPWGWDAESLRLARSRPPGVVS